MKKQSGFTLIELLLVLAIIGIISAIAIPALLGQRARAKQKAVLNMITNVTGECARVNDTLKENSTAAVTAATVVASTLSLSNFQYPAARNPYGGTAHPYRSAAGANGEVSLISDEAYVDTATSRTYAAVLITGYYVDSATNTSGSSVKVVALD